MSSGGDRPSIPDHTTGRALAGAAGAGRGAAPRLRPHECPGAAGRVGAHRRVGAVSADACLSLHQDRDERDQTAPIVSVSLGLPAVFLWGGLKRKDPTRRIPLVHGDVLVWSGPDRLRYHGVLPLKAGQHVLLGEQRINLTFRKAGW